MPSDQAKLCACLFCKAISSYVSVEVNRCGLRLGDDACLVSRRVERPRIGYKQGHFILRPPSRRFAVI